MRRLPSLNALRTFESAARLGSFSAAARELYVTQGAVSRAIQGLEEWLGVALFAREGKAVRLTPAGASYRDEIGAALDRLAVATAHVLEQKGSAGVLRVDALPTLTVRWLIPRLPRFQARFPGLEVHLSTSDAPVRAGEPFDVAIRRGPEPWPGLRAARFLDERSTPVCSPTLLKRQKLAAPEDLAKHTLLHADARPEAWKEWLRAQRIEKLQPAANLRFDHFYLAVQAALDGLGVAMGPLPLLSDELASGRLVAPFPDRLAPARSYHAVVQGRRVSAAAQAFVTWLQEEGRGAVDEPAVPAPRRKR